MEKTLLSVSLGSVRNRVTDDTITQLHTLETDSVVLAALSLSKCQYFSEIGLERLTSFTNLRHLDLSGTLGFAWNNGKALQILKDHGTALLAPITRLSLAETELGDHGLATLAKLPLPALLSLDLSRTRVSSSGIETWVRLFKASACGLQLLTSLRLRGCRSVGAAAIGAFIDSQGPFRELRLLDVTGTGFSSQECKELQKQWEKAEPHHPVSLKFSGGGGVVHRSGWPAPAPALTLREASPPLLNRLLGPQQQKQLRTAKRVVKNATPSRTAASAAADNTSSLSTVLKTPQRRSFLSPISSATKKKFEFSESESDLNSSFSYTPLKPHPYLISPDQNINIRTLPTPNGHQLSPTQIATTPISSNHVAQKRSNSPSGSSNHNFPLTENGQTFGPSDWAPYLDQKTQSFSLSQIAAAALRAGWQPLAANPHRLYYHVIEDSDTENFNENEQNVCHESPRVQFDPTENTLFSAPPLQWVAEPESEQVLKRAKQELPVERVCSLSPSANEAGDQLIFLADSESDEEEKELPTRIEEPLFKDTKSIRGPPREIRANQANQILEINEEISQDEKDTDLNETFNEDTENSNDENNENSNDQNENINEDTENSNDENNENSNDQNENINEDTENSNDENNENSNNENENINENSNDENNENSSDENDEDTENSNDEEEIDEESRNEELNHPKTLFGEDFDSSSESVIPSSHSAEQLYFHLPTEPEIRFSTPKPQAKAQSNFAKSLDMNLIRKVQIQKISPLRNTRTTLSTPPCTPHGSLLLGKDTRRFSKGQTFTSEFHSPFICSQPRAFSRTLREPARNVSITIELSSSPCKSASAKSSLKQPAASPRVKNHVPIREWLQIRNEDLPQPPWSG